MSRIIGILNYKGGTAKTTTVVNLAAGLSARGPRVLCIDLDPQGSLATQLGVRYTHTLADLLLDRVKPEGCIIQARYHLDLIPSDSDLLQTEGQLWRRNDDQAVRRALVDRLNGVEKDYDYILVDFSPSVSLLSESGLTYARELIVPVAMSYMGLIGLRQVIQTLQRAQSSVRNPARLYLIVPTFFSSRRKQDQEILDTLRQHFGDRVADPIRDSVQIVEAPSHHQTIFEYDPHSAGAEDYRELVERIHHDG